MPRVSRPPESRSTVAACLASSAVLARSGEIRMLVARPIRSVTAAAAASVVSGSQLLCTRRSMVPRVE